ncbi:hypothetical protein H696_02631 [Fonticula alba]|uniref:Homologous-pairing protein 2 homolog n=1 Tax=Fonticula alba TaxID=691883 RepID=A0A058Z9T9_FONAL|nr:hypothetical protein H696_02631 [Fonticula alba]KCV70302.1 hypothetical protein H696_02631 [Fonticula alba]|eukprot:XP_009494818.1 hypothetical protein H696_02631 [Fonticula alba]
MGKRRASRSPSPFLNVSSDDGEDSFSEELYSPGEESADSSQDSDEETFSPSPSPTAAPKRAPRAAASRAAAAASSGNDEQIVLQYFQKQNRPYNLADIFSNLHGAIKKAPLKKVLQSLTDSGHLTMKVYGKQQVFVANQDLIDVPDTELITASEQEVAELEQALQQERAAVRELNQTLTATVATLPNEELKARIEELRETNKKLETKLERLQTEAIQLTPEEIAQVNQSHRKYHRLYRDRKRLCMDILDGMLEHAPMSKEQLFEDIGLETDQDVGFHPTQAPS